MADTASQLPFGWVCFSNYGFKISELPLEEFSLNCLSAGSVSLTALRAVYGTAYVYPGLNCLSAGSVSLTQLVKTDFAALNVESQLPFGWVCFSNCHCVSGCLARAKWRERSGVGGGRGEMAVGFVAAKARR